MRIKYDDATAYTCKSKTDTVQIKEASVKNICSRNLGVVAYAIAVAPPFHGYQHPAPASKRRERGAVRSRRFGVGGQTPPSLPREEGLAPARSPRDAAGAG